MFTRRSFLKTSGLVALGAGAPQFLTRTALAAPNAGKAGAKDTVLAVVELTGGNDGLNTVIPFKDPLYAKYRPTLSGSVAHGSPGGPDPHLSSARVAARCGSGPPGD